MRHLVFQIIQFRNKFQVSQVEIMYVPSYKHVEETKFVIQELMLPMDMLQIGYSMAHVCIVFILNKNLTSVTGLCLGRSVTVKWYFSYSLSDNGIWILIKTWLATLLNWNEMNCYPWMQHSLDWVKWMIKSDTFINGSFYSQQQFN